MSLEVQSTALQVIDDVKTDKVRKDTFWVSVNDKTTNIDVYKVDGIIEYRAQDLGIQCKVDEKNVIIDAGNGQLTARFPSNHYSFTTKDITSLDVSPLGELLVVGDNEGGVSIAATNENAVRRKLDGHLLYTTVSRFFPSGQVVLSAGVDMKIRIWSAVDGSNPRTLVGHKGSINDVVIIGRGRNLLSCADNDTVKLWEVSSEQVIRNYHDRAEHLAVVGSLEPNGTESSTELSESTASPLEFETAGKHAIASYGSTLSVFDIRSPHPSTFNVDAPITALASSGGLSPVVVTGHQSAVTVRDSRTWNELYSITTSSSVTSLHLLDNRLAVTEASGHAFIVDTTNQVISESLVGNELRNQCITINGNDVYVAGKGGSLRKYQL